MANRGVTPKKDMIFYARDYRHFTATVGNTSVFALLCVLPVVLVFVLFYSPITRALCVWAGNIVASVTGESVSMLSTPFLPHLGGVFYLALPGSLPSYTHALIAGLLTVVAIPIVSQARRNSRPLMIYCCMGLYVLLISCLFFLFFPEHFPYTLSTYSQLYMVQAAALWIILPALFGVALALMRANIVARLVAILVQVAVMMLYNAVRYVVYLCFLYFCSSLYMATLFFTFGVLFDFIHMVTLYAFFAKKVSEQYNSPEGRSQWAWS
ncbi:MAG: hypothetical protein Q4E65_07475 [Clostridia bacterium]|nr:hypothetical protein [Clostridia bacterium]